MADNVLGTNELLTINDQVNESGLEDLFVSQAVGETKTRTLKSLLLGGTAVGRVLDILGLREQNPSEMVEQLEEYRLGALRALNNNICKTGSGDLNASNDNIPEVLNKEKNAA